MSIASSIVLANLHDELYKTQQMEQEDAAHFWGTSWTQNDDNDDSKSRKLSNSTNISTNKLFKYARTVYELAVQNGNNDQLILLQ